MRSWDSMAWLDFGLNDTTLLQLIPNCWAHSFLGSTMIFDNNIAQHLFHSYKQKEKKYKLFICSKSSSASFHLDCFQRQKASAWFCRLQIRWTRGNCGMLANVMTRPAGADFHVRQPKSHNPHDKINTVNDNKKVPDQVPTLHTPAIHASIYRSICLSICLSVCLSVSVSD